MDQSQSPCCAIFLILVLVIVSLNAISAQTLVEYKIAKLSTSWINTPSAVINDSRPSKPILFRGNFGSGFACGFYCNYTNTACIFAVIIQNGKNINKRQLVWSANRDHPVKINATLQLTQDGDLILADSDGTFVWSTNTGGRSVSGLNLTEEGNLVLFDRNNATIWQSFDHPTDSLLLRQKLVLGQKLTASISASNWSRGLYSLAVHHDGMFATLESNPPGQFYSKSDLKGNPYVKFENGSFNGYTIPLAYTAQFMRLEPDGHLKVYEWGGYDWKVVADLLTVSIGQCGYPMVCGKYGICTNGQCGCPEEASSETSSFRQINYRQPNLGCHLVTPISCDHSQYHCLLELKYTRYFLFNSVVPYNGETKLEDCKKTCLNNCSCKAALFAHRWGNVSRGSCLLLSEVFSFMNSEAWYANISVFVKVQKSPISRYPSSVDPLQKISRRFIFILGIPSLGAFIGVFFWAASCSFPKRMEKETKELELVYLDHVPGMPTRFSYEDLKAKTGNFSTKLGEGGFGCVFQGTLADGTKVAVKCLDGVGRITKSFLAEVETIGSIHHFNLVRLIGFAAENSHRLLVYEYMSNGSLDKWIFHRNPELALGWTLRRKIILDIAKGLAYLHEDCRQKIFHLDIKPQNILLDENFNAKLADFGLSKLIDKDQSEVMTTMKGTPGYMAPEWLSSFITEKVDVYSFGVVVLEILCGRRNLDQSQPEEDMHLLSRFKKTAEEEQLLNMVDKYSEDMQLHGEEVVEMMKVSAWCLQNDFKRRPSMTVVVQVLEGLVNVQDNLDYNFTNRPAKGTVAANCNDVDAVDDATPLLPSILSGPR